MSLRVWASLPLGALADWTYNVQYQMFVSGHECYMDSFDGGWSGKWKDATTYKYWSIDECKDLCNAQDSCFGFNDNREQSFPNCNFKTGGSVHPKERKDFYEKIWSPGPAPSVPSGAIVSRQNGKCMDLPGADASDGNRLWTWDCNGGPSQRWAFVDNIIYWDGGVVWTHCLDLPGNDFSNGNSLQMWQCNGGPQQQWGYDFDLGTIYLASSADVSKCLDLQDGGMDDGTPLQLWDCLASWNQQFDLGPALSAHRKGSVRGVVV